MESTAVYCSDVMHFPETFEGTRGIVHPDDLQKVSGALQLLADGLLPNLDFRLITTWGEVKLLSGKNVSLEKSGPPETAEKEFWEGPLQQLALLREAEFLKQRTDLADAAEKIHRIGSWAINKSTGEAWYSDGMYRIHNLPPQSLNAYANTFLGFVHPEDRATVTDALETAYSHAVPLHVEYRIVIAGGETRTVRLITNWLYNKNGQPLFTGVLRDLSEERKAADEAETAGQSAKFHQQVMRFSEHYWNTGYWFVNLVTRKVVYSENYYRIYGLKQQVLPGYNAFLNLVHPDDRDRIHDLISRMYTEHQLPEAGFRIIRPDGKQRQLKQSGKVFISGRDLIMIGAVQDVTVQKGLEKKVAELNDKIALQELVQAVAGNLSETGFIVWYPDGHVHWSEGFYRMLGYKPEAVEALSRLLYRQIHPDDLKAFKDAELLIFNGQSPDDLWFRILSKGGFRQLSISFHRIASSGREVAVGVVQDRTREAALHQKLTDTTQFGETLSAATSDAVLLTDKENTVLAWNRAAAEKTGIKGEEALYSNLFDLFPALNEESYLKQLRTVMLGSEVRELKAHNLYLRKPHNYYLVPMPDENGETTRVLHVVQDVSRELELQQQLSERLNFIESLVEASIDRIVVLDKYMNYVYWNKRAEEYYALSKARVIGRNILEIFPGLRSDPNYNEFRKVLRGETVYLPPLLTDENTEYFETYLIPIKDGGEVSAILWIVHDLSNELQLQRLQRKAKQQLEEEHRRLKEAQAIGRVGSFEWNAALDKIYWSDEMYRIHGLAPQSENLTLERVLSFIHPADLAASVESLQQSRRNAGVLSMTHRIIRADGVVRVVARNLQSVADESGTVTHLSGTITDITEQKEVEEKLQEKTHYLQRIQETVPDMISILELATGRYDFLNKETFLAHGFDPDKMNQYSPQERARYLHPEDRTDLAVFFKKLETASDEDVVTAEYRAKDFNDVWKWFFVRARVFQRNAMGTVTHVLNVIENITDRKIAEQETKESRAFIEEVTQTTPDLITINDAVTSNVIYANHNDFWNDFYLDEPATLYHLKDEARVAVMVHDDYLEKAKQHLWERRFLKDKEVREVELKMKHNKWIRIRSKVFKRNEKGEATQIISFTTDISKRKKVEEEILHLKDEKAQRATDRYYSLFNSIDDGFCIIEVLYDEEGKASGYRFVEVNQTFERQTGLKNVVGKTGRELAIGSESSWMAIYDKVAKTGESVRFEHYHHATQRWYEAYASRVGGAESRQVAIVFNDITERKKTEVALRESEEKLRRFNASLAQQVNERTAALKNTTEEVQKHLAILQQAEDIAAIGSWEYQIAPGHFSWSDGMYRIFDYPAGAPVQPEIYLDRVVDEERAVAKRIVKQLRNLYQPFEETLHINRKDGVRLLKVKATVVCDKEGKPQKLVGVDKDITHIRNAEDQLAQSRYWLEQTTKVSPDAITIYDLQKKEPLYLNDCLAHWTGVSAIELVNMGIEGRLQLIHPDDRLPLLHFNEKIAAAKDGQVLMMEYRLLSKNEGIRWLRNRSKIFQRDKNGKVTHLLSILQDVTEERQGEARLKELNESLEAKNKDLENKNEEITSFAFVASHDLKEPLRKIHTFSDWLLTKEEGISENGKQSLERLIGSVKRLDTLVDDIVALTKVHVGDEDSTAVDLNNVLHLALADMQDVIQRTNTKIVADGLPVVNGIENHLLYLFKNLLSNAIKFQPAGNQPVVRIEAVRNEDGVQISFADNGIGFAPEHRKKIFQMFRRLHGRTEYEGTGMGLAICKKIMEKHGGGITAEGKPGEGSVFVCHFPHY